MSRTGPKYKNKNAHHTVFPFFNMKTTVTVGTQAAVLAGLDITMFIEFNPPGDHTWVRLFRLLRFIAVWFGVTDGSYNNKFMYCNVVYSLFLTQRCLCTPSAVLLPRAKCNRPTTACRRADILGRHICLEF
jgi:hypothetical protein